MRQLVPLALIGLIAAAVATTRKASAKAGNVVAVPVARLMFGGGPTTLPPGTIPPDSLAAIQVDFAEGNQLRGSLVGTVNAATKVVTFPAPIGLGLFSFTQDDVVGIEKDGRIN